MLPRATADLYRAEQERVAETLTVLRGEWGAASGPRAADALAPRLALLLAAAMIGAARDGAASVGPALAATGFDVTPVARVDPRGFGASASDGRPLVSLLRGPSLVAASSGMDAGRALLNVIAHTQVADAARGGASVAITARPRVGWVRMVNPPCCQDCAVLAGKWFRFNEGFERHKRCDCVHRPAHEDEPPSGYAQDVPVDQIHDLTVGQRAALDAGADLNRTVNAYRREVPGRRTRMTTTTERGTRGTARLTPDGIYRIAGDDRDRALALLRQHGYLLP